MKIPAPNWARRRLWVAILTGKAVPVQRRPTRSRRKWKGNGPGTTGLPIRCPPHLSGSSYEFALMCLSEAFRGKEFTSARATEWLTARFRNLFFSNDSLGVRLRFMGRKIGIRRMWKVESHRYPAMWKSDGVPSERMSPPGRAKDGSGT